MENVLSKSELKTSLFHYLQDVEQTGKVLIITDRGKPVLKIIPYIEENAEDILKSLRNSVITYDNPTEPVGLDDWDVLK